MPNLMPFYFDTHEVRVHIDDEGAPWWEAQDVCAILDIHDVSKAVARLHIGEKRTSESRNVLIINESGLYRLIFRSNKSEAQRFQDWVFQEVLPTIRKTGTYELTGAPLPQVKNPAHQLMIDMVVRMDEQEERLKILAAQHQDQMALTIANQQQTIDALERAVRAEGKADLALEDAHRMTVEEFVLKNGLVRQFPPPRWKTIATWLGTFCEQWSLHVPKAPVVGKPWNEENAYPLQAFAAWLRMEQHKPQQVRLVKEE